MWYFWFLFLFKSCFKVKIFEWRWATKRYKEPVLRSCFAFDLSLGLESGKSCRTSSGCLFRPPHWMPSQSRGWPNNQGSHEHSLRFFLKEPFTETLLDLRRPEVTLIPFFGATENAVGHLWQGITDLCLLPSPSNRADWMAFLPSSPQE